MNDINDTYVSLVIPAYNEAENIKHTLETVCAYFSKQHYAWEVIVSDDGSTDTTVSLVRQFMTNAEEVKLKQNLHKGKANAVREGVLSAQGKYIIFTDADLATPITEVDKALEAFSQRADVVIGSREMGTRADEPKLRHIMGRVYNHLVQLILLKGISDTQAGFKGFTHDAAFSLFNALKVFGPNQKVIKAPSVTGFDLEVLLLAQKKHYRITVIPIQWTYKPSTRVSPLRDSLKMFWEIIKIKLAHFGS